MNRRRGRRRSKSRTPIILQQAAQREAPAALTNGGFPALTRPSTLQQSPGAKPSGKCSPNASGGQRAGSLLFPVTEKGRTLRQMHCRSPSNQRSRTLGSSSQLSHNPSGSPAAFGKSPQTSISQCPSLDSGSLFPNHCKAITTSFVLEIKY